MVTVKGHRDGDYGLVAWLPTLLQRTCGLARLKAGGFLVIAIKLVGTDGDFDKVGFI